MNLSIIPDGIWKIVYKYAIDDISDLITFDTTIEDFKTFITFLAESKLTNILYNRILISCAKCGNERIFKYLTSDNPGNVYISGNVYIPENSPTAFIACAFIACEYGQINIVSYVMNFCSFSKDDERRLFILSLKNLHFKLALWLYGKFLLLEEDTNIMVDDALYICKSEDKEKILEFARKKWNYESDLPGLEPI